MPQPISEFLRKLRQFVEDEAEAQFSALAWQWSRSLQDRVAHGWAIEGLRIEHFQNGASCARA